MQFGKVISLIINIIFQFSVDQPNAKNKKMLREICPFLFGIFSLLLTLRSFQCHIETFCWSKRLSNWGAASLKCCLVILDPSEHSNSMVTQSNHRPKPLFIKQTLTQIKLLMNEVLVTKDQLDSQKTVQQRPIKTLNSCLRHIRKSFHNKFWMEVGQVLFPVF